MTYYTPGIGQSTGGTTDEPIVPLEGGVVPVHVGRVPVNPPAPEVDSGATVPSMSDFQFLRVILQEVVPNGGQDSDTLFLENHIQEIWNRSQGIMSVAAALGWSIKAGALLVLVDRNDGLSEKKLSQMAVMAQKVATMWQQRADADSAAMGRSWRPVGATARVWDAGTSNLWNQIWDVTHVDRFYLPWNVIES